MKHYFDLNSTAFYVSDLNTSIPDSAIVISEEQHIELLTAINSGCIIFDDLTYSEPKPDGFFKWINGCWIEDIDAKNNAIIEKNKIKKIDLLNLATEKISVLQDIVDFDMQEANEDEQLKAWKKFRILISRIDPNTIEITWPQKPQ